MISTKAFKRVEVVISMQKLIVLTQTIEEGMTVYPGDPRPRIKRFKTIEKDGVNLSEIRLDSHTGTHVDSPYHFIRRD